MRLGDLATSSGTFRKAIRALRLRWEETKEGWNDANSKQFEEQYLVELEQSCMKAAEHMDRISQVLNKACKECS